MDDEHVLDQILRNGSISTVFQPIVSLDAGSVFGYEALSRISLPGCDINIEELLEIAHHHNRLWELEKLCRTRALQSALSQDFHHTLFLNVDVNTISEPTFRTGFTVEKLREFGIRPECVVIEITEKRAFQDVSSLLSSVEHYRKQGFQIAIDDYGAGYSGLNRLCSLHPKYLKVDKLLIRDIHKQPLKRSAVSSIVEFCRQADIRVIAEGIETEDELRAVIQLGIMFGQGYYLCRPDPLLEEIAVECRQQIREFFMRTRLHSSFFASGTIGELIMPGATALTSSPVLQLYDRFNRNPGITEIFLLDEEAQICGILPRQHVLELLSGQFGYSLNSKKLAKEIMIPEVLVVNELSPIDEVSKLAMQRSTARVYDSIAITRNERHLGKVTIRELLLSSIQLQIQRATEANPLTGLPGNFEIQRMISCTLQKSDQWSIVYIDIDNFKAYNDAYGFVNGDKMLKTLADVMRRCAGLNDFIGHIGGDDFVIVIQSHEVEEVCQNIIKVFHDGIEAIYSSVDWEKGYIVSKDRSGFTQNYNIASLSIAVVTNRTQNPNTLDDLSLLIAQTKKKCKQMDGDAIVFM